MKDSTVGIYVLTKKNTIRRVKEPECYRDSLDLECIFKIMNKPEYESLVMQLNGNLPQVTQIKYYSECKRIVCDKTTEEVYPAFLRELKKETRLKSKNIIMFQVRCGFWFILQNTERETTRI